eukprot:CFRG7316T1
MSDAQAQKYHTYTYELDTKGLESSLKRSSTAILSHSEEAKIAFLFLGCDGHTQSAIWESFFNHAEDEKYNIYVHRTNPTPNSGDFLQQYANYQEVSITSSSWCALMGVQYSLLQAALRDPTNEQFVFVSHNSIPLKSFSYIYGDLIEDSKYTSKFCFTSLARNMESDCRFQDQQRGRTSDTLKHHQWVILSRAHARVVLYEKGRSSLDHFDSLRLSVDGKYNNRGMCSDESVPGLALIQKAKDLGALRNGSDSDDVFSGLESIGVEQRCTTFVYWKNCLKNTPFDLGERSDDKHIPDVHPLTLSRLTERYLEQLVKQPSLLFARKFDKNAEVVVGDEVQNYTEALGIVLLKYIQNVTTFDSVYMKHNKLARISTINRFASLLVSST